MTTHHTKTKGDLGVAKVSLDLAEKGYQVFFPVFSEHLRFDLAAYRDGKFHRIQAKHRAGGKLSNKTSWTDKNGNHYLPYDSDDFDYYGIYHPILNRCLYPSIKFAGRRIAHELPANVNEKGYLWWEDFLELTDQASPRFDYDEKKKFLTISNLKPAARKVPWPSKELLEKLVWEIPTSKIALQYGVSDKAVASWAKKYGISRPGRGYWRCTS